MRVKAGRDKDAKDDQRREDLEGERFCSDEEFQSSLVELQKVIEETRLDAARYRYIRRVLGEAIAENPHIAGFQIRPPGKKYWFDKQQDIDEAINYAMKYENN